MRSSPVMRAQAFSPFSLHHPVVDLAREQAQRQADHARAVGKHPLHGKVRLAGVGGAENGPDTLPVIGSVAGGQSVALPLCRKIRR